MKCLILAAGYATRLYPLTENFPKPLLKVKNKTILDWLIEDIKASEEVDEFIVISNHKFLAHFEEWADNRAGITVIDDGTTSNDSRLGAVRDVQFAIDRLSLDDDMLVIAGDNLLDFSLSVFINYAKSKKTSAIMRYFEEDESRLKKSGVLEIDENDLVIGMEEKPQNPKSNWCCPPFYYYTQKDARLIRQGIADGCSTDAPGSYIAWLCTKADIHAMQMPGKRYDIGTLDSYHQINEEYLGIS